MSKTHGLTVTFVWQEIEGVTLKDALLVGLGKGLDDLLAEDGLIRELQVGRDSENNPVYLISAEDSAPPTAVNLFVVGEMGTPPDLENSEAPAGDETAGGLVVTMDDIEKSGGVYVAKPEMGKG